MLLGVVDMEVAMKLEDDLFFADLSKQISLLIMDDDEDPVANYHPVAFQDISREYRPYEPTCKSERKGTGVFIPRSSQPRRKSKQGKRYALNSKKQKQQQHDNTTKMVYHQEKLN